MGQGGGWGGEGQERAVVCARSKQMRPHLQADVCYWAGRRPHRPLPLTHRHLRCSPPCRAGSAILLALGGAHGSLLMDCGEGTWGQMVRCLGPEGARAQVRNGTGGGGGGSKRFAQLTTLKIGSSVVWARLQRHA